MDVSLLGTAFSQLPAQAVPWRKEKGTAPVGARGKEEGPLAPGQEGQEALSCLRCGKEKVKRAQSKTSVIIPLITKQMQN